MKHVKIYEEYDPEFDYILYMDNGENWISVDENIRNKLLQLINNEITQFTTNYGSRKFTAKLGTNNKTKVVLFTTEEGIEEFINVKKILNKIT